MMTAYTYQRPISMRRFSVLRLCSRIAKRLLGHELLVGAVLWFTMIFLITRVYIWRVG